MTSGGLLEDAVSSDGQYLSERVTILFITSPSFGNPAVRLIEEVACSLSLVPGLTQCAKLIIADGIKVNFLYLLTLWLA